MVDSDTDARKQLGDRMRELREAKGWTRQETAERAGLPLRSLEKWEQGVAEPGWFNVVALAAALGVSCDAFTVPPTSTDTPKRGRPKKENN